ncbi:cytochrome c-type biogenesis protein CcmH [Roseibium aquae]|uniref:Cytochrome c-type biogenesis protein n=1 Tax=Roseibium aquae TaxID=1323746 RepID=A0A916X2B0_9HYPH|nr:cytochrome c-type biogenesis protein [Roseibium aquae]GGB63190.1 cytochrome c-type biogenesis protein CcmH [Roseibium aquae]
MLRSIFALLLCAAVGLGSALAVTPDEVLDDPVLEERARDLSRNLRCMVCQNESIDESNAPLAKDLRVLVRERLVAGDSNDQVIDFLVGRYGEYVLLKPRFAAHTLVLWAAAPVALLAGIGGLIMVVRRRRDRFNPVSAPPLDADEQARLDALLKTKD